MKMLLVFGSAPAGGRKTRDSSFDAFLLYAVWGGHAKNFGMEAGGGLAFMGRRNRGGYRGGADTSQWTGL